MTPAERRVLLVHGLWMHSFTLRWLATRLRSRGYNPQPFGYYSLLQDTDAVVGRLADTLRAAPRAHVVAHSLGGLLALRAAQDVDAPQVGRIVCLGSPLAGSQAASTIATRVPAGGRLIGHNRDLLNRGIGAIPPGLEVGAIAGCVPRGLGGLLAGFQCEHDGTVAVGETRVPGLADHVVVRASHSGLMFSDGAVRQAAAFLQNGHFDRE